MHARVWTCLSACVVKTLMQICCPLPFSYFEVFIIIKLCNLGQKSILLQNVTLPPSSLLPSLMACRVLPSKPLRFGSLVRYIILIKRQLTAAFLPSTPHKVLFILYSAAPSAVYSLWKSSFIFFFLLHLTLTPSLNEKFSRNSCHLLYFYQTIIYF